MATELIKTGLPSTSSDIENSESLKHRKDTLMVTMIRITLVGIIATLLIVIFHNHIDAALFNAGFDNAHVITDWLVTGATVVGGIPSAVAVYASLEALKQVH